MDVRRLLRDIEDGVILLDKGGTILEMNPSAAQMLGLEKDYTGEKYHVLLSDTSKDKNDDFHQMLLEAISDKKHVHRRRVSFLCADGGQRVFDVSASIIMAQEGDDTEGVFLSISDVTKEEALRKKVSASSQVFIILLGIVCLWVYIFAVWRYFGEPMSTSVLSKLLVLIGLIPAFLTRRTLHLSYEDVGLKVKGIKNAIKTDCILTALGILLLILAKFFLLRFVPGFFEEGLPFFIFSKYPVIEYFGYAASVIAQEFISRGVVHESMRRVIPGRYSEAIATALSAFLFGALHVHVGLVYMLGASILLGVLGLVYNKQRTIWGLCIPHYALGMLLGIMDFVAY